MTIPGKAEAAVSGCLNSFAFGIVGEQKCE